MQNRGYLLYNLAFHAVFTNLGAKGSHGPSASDSPYAGQDHYRQVTITNGIQQWTVPYTGYYRIEAIGATGGCDYWYSKMFSCGGTGAKLIGEFRLNMSEVIQVLVGQEGGSNINARGSGGGGGTFVVSGNSTPLIIAGGGGGGLKDKKRHGRCNANTSRTGNAAGYKGKVWVPISIIEKAHTNISSLVSAVKSYEKIIIIGYYEIIAIRAHLLVNW